VNFIRKVKLKDWLEVDIAMANLAEGETPADPVCSFNTSKCCMSVFAIDNQESASRIAAALISKAGNLQVFEYVIFSSTDVKDIGFSIKNSPGMTDDAEINKLHYDLGCISAQKLIQLTDRLISKERYPDACNRVPQKDVARHIIAGIKGGLIEEKKVNKTVLDRARKLLNPNK